MTPTAESLNTQWDILQGDFSTDNVALIDPLNEFTSNEPAVLTPQVTYKQVAYEPLTRIAYSITEIV